MVPRANTWQLWGKIIFRHLTTLVCHCISHWDASASLCSSASADLCLFCKPAGVAALLVCPVLTPGCRLHGCTSQVCFSHGGQKLPEEQGRNSLGCKLRDIVLCSIWGPCKSHTKATIKAQRGKLLSWMSGKGKGCLLNRNLIWASLIVAQSMKNLPVNAGDAGSVPGSGRCPGGGNGNPLQDSCLGDHMGIGVWWVAKSQTRLSD